MSLKEIISKASMYGVLYFLPFLLITSGVCHIFTIGLTPFGISLIIGTPIVIWTLVESEKNYQNAKRDVFNKSDEDVLLETILGTSVSILILLFGYMEGYF